MDIRELTYFLEVANELNITKAAENLHMSQPPLSRAMQLLEEELGVKLFVRGKRKISLTPEGVYLKEQANQLIALASKTKDQILELSNEVSGMLYIGSVESLAAGLMPKLIQKFHGQYEKIHFNWWSGNSDDVLNRLEKGLVDVAIVRAPCDLEKFNCISLGTEPWSAFISEDHPIAKKDEQVITLEELDKEPLIIPARKSREREISEWFADKGLEANIDYAISPIINAVALVEYNMGIAILPDSARDYIHNKRIVVRPITNPTKESEIIFVYNKYTMMSEAAKRFIDFIIKENEIDE